jgi:hypothetical protein
VVRWATLVLLTLVGCSDLRDFRGSWRGRRVGEAVLQVRVPDAAATLEIDNIDTHEIAARLTIEGFLPETPIASLPAAEADVLAGLTFSGSPLRVYLTFAAMPDRAGDALVVLALYDDRRVEVRMLRSGAAPLYGVFALTESPTASSRESPPGSSRESPPASPGSPR